MKIVHAYIIAVLMLGLVSCRKSHIDPVDVSTVPIDFNVAQATKATIFEEDADLIESSKGGGDFTVSAYKSGTAERYIYNRHVWYFQDGRSWHFYDDDVNNVTDVYWPNTFDLDFVAYMPYQDASCYTGVTLHDYTAADGPSFSCDLPLDGTGQENLYEFIYAYEKNQNKDNIGSDGRKGVVKLNFRHPFSSVVIRLSESYRMAINWIKLTGIYNEGVFDAANGWTPASGAVRKDLNVNIGKNVPDDINYNTPIGGPYVIMPQDLNVGVFLEINFNRDDEPAETKSVCLYAPAIPKWEPGKRYTYNLTMGDPLEEILFNVAVEEWHVIDYKNEIEVE